MHWSPVHLTTESDVINRLCPPSCESIGALSLRSFQWPAEFVSFSSDHFPHCKTRIERFLHRPFRFVEQCQPFRWNIFVPSWTLVNVYPTYGNLNVALWQWQMNIGLRRNRVPHWKVSSCFEIRLWIKYAHQCMPANETIDRLFRLGNGVYSWRKATYGYSWTFTTRRLVPRHSGPSCHDQFSSHEW
jgi:hypothetical protein